MSGTSNAIHADPDVRSTKVIDLFGLLYRHDHEDKLPSACCKPEACEGPDQELDGFQREGHRDLASGVAKPRAENSSKTLPDQMGFVAEVPREQDSHGESMGLMV